MKDKKISPKFRKRFGQHFLQDSRVIENIISSINLKKKDHIVEIGPGLGALTQKLLQTNCHIDAIEVDRDLAKKLNEKFIQIITSKKDSNCLNFKEIKKLGGIFN